MSVLNLKGCCKFSIYRHRSISQIIQFRDSNLAIYYYKGRSSITSEQILLSIDTTGAFFCYKATICHHLIVLDHRRFMDM